MFVAAGVVGRTRVAHQRESAARTVINVEVGAVVKAGIARAAQAELVFIALHSAFIRSEGNHGGRRSSRCSIGSRSPVVRSSSSSHRRSVVSESGATIHHKVEKAIQLFQPTRWNHGTQTKSRNRKKRFPGISNHTSQITHLKSHISSTAPGVAQTRVYRRGLVSPQICPVVASTKAASPKRDWKQWSQVNVS